MLTKPAGNGLRWIRKVEQIHESLLQRGQGFRRVRAGHLLFHDHPLIYDGEHAARHKVEKGEITCAAFMERLQHLPEQCRP